MTAKQEWVLTTEAFELLLARLDPDRERAGQRYERIRLKLVKYFEWRGAACPDDEADETINRVARRMAQGAEVHDLEAYFYGVARLVFAESVKARERERRLPPFDLATADPAGAADAEERHRCLEHCLAKLADDSRALITEYYREEGGAKVAHRKLMAGRLGLPLNALRIRAHRIRATLEACLRDCLGR